MICFAQSYWCFHAQAFKESLFFSEMWTSCVGVLLTGLQHLRLYSITALQEEEISSRTTLQSFTRAAEDTVDLDDVEINLLRSPQSFEDMLLIWGFRIIGFWLIYLISHSFIGMYGGLRTESNSIIIKTMWVVRNMIRVRVFKKGDGASLSQCHQSFLVS